MASPPRSSNHLSGNPARRAQSKQQLAEERARNERAEQQSHLRMLQRRRRSTAAWWIRGTAAAVAVAVTVVLSFVLAPQPEQRYAAGSEGIEIEGVETFDNTTEHVEGTVDYPQTPPAGGPHNNGWLNCGVYTEPQQNEYAVHSLEHGTVWITFDPQRVTDAEVETLREYLPASYALISPYPGMDTPIAVSAWNAQLKVDSATDPRIAEFFEEYWRSQNVPEPNAPCTGGVDGPGRQ